jgi:hypothetical protein
MASIAYRLQSAWEDPTRNDPTMEAEHRGGRATTIHEMIVVSSFPESGGRLGPSPHQSIFRGGPMRVTTTAKHPDIDSHWRCGEVWNLSRRHEGRDGGFSWR